MCLNLLALALAHMLLDNMWYTAAGSLLHGPTSYVFAHTLLDSMVDTDSGSTLSEPPRSTLAHTLLDSPHADSRGLYST